MANNKYWHKEKAIKPQVIPVWLNLVVTTSTERFARENRVACFSDIPGFVTSNGDDVAVVITPEASPSEIAHEAVHATVRMFENVGEPKPLGNEEVFCYYVQWIVHELIQFQKETKRARRNASKARSRTKL